MFSFFRDPETNCLGEHAEGFFFIAVTSSLLYVQLIAYLSQLERQRELLQRKKSAFTASLIRLTMPSSCTESMTARLSTSTGAHLRYSAIHVKKSCTSTLLVCRRIFRRIRLMKPANGCTKRWRMARSILSGRPGAQERALFWMNLTMSEAHVGGEK